MAKTKTKWIFYDSMAKLQSNPITTIEAQLAIFKMRPRDTERFFIWTAGWEEWQCLKAYLETSQPHFVSSFTPASLDEDTVKASREDILKMKPVTQDIEDEVSQATFVPIESDQPAAPLTQTKSFSKVIVAENEKETYHDDHGFDTPSFDGDDVKISNTKIPNLDFKKLNKTKSLDNRAPRHEVKIEVLLISSKGKTFRSNSKNISLTGSLLEDSIPFDYCGVTFDVVVINKQVADPRLQRVPLKARTVGDGLTQRIFYVDPTPEQKLALKTLLENYIEGQSAKKPA